MCVSNVFGVGSKIPTYVFSNVFGMGTKISKHLFFNIFKMGTKITTNVTIMALTWALLLYIAPRSPHMRCVLLSLAWASLR